MIELTIDGKSVLAQPGATVLQAALQAGIDVPHLCFDPRVEPIGSCRMCLVKIEGRPGTPVSCATSVAPGMKVTTEDDELGRIRKGIMELVFSEHSVTCPTCERDGECKLQDYAYRYGVDQSRFGTQQRHFAANFTSQNRGIAYEPDKCILCGLCVKYCEEVQQAGALAFVGPAYDMEVSTAFGIDLHESSCEMCGGCVRVCPAGAMVDKQAIGKGRDRDLAKVRTTCTYCGVGCEQVLYVDREANRIVRSTSISSSPINGGNLCVKGHFAHEFVSSPERMTTPLVKRNGEFETATWEEALDLVASRLLEIREKHGPEALAFLSSARCTNEENYLMQKLARAAGTNNVDQCATTCHAPSVEGLAASLGSGAMTNSVAEIRDVDVVFAIGANPTEAHPIIGLELKRAVRRGAKLIVCDPRKTWLAERATIHIQHRPGTDNMLINAILRTIVDEGLADLAFVEERTEGYEDLVAGLRGISVKDAAKICDVPEECIREVARMYAQGKPSSIFYTLGITEHACGTDNVKNLANLAMLCGQIGKWASGINPLRGQNNVQGACDMGAMAHRLPGYQRWDDEATRAKFEEAWGVKLPTDAGGRITDFVERMGTGEVKALYVMGEDPVFTEPNTALVIEQMERAEFIVCQEIFLTETAKMADVVLPGACWAEKDGTFTASERRVQRVRKAVEPPGHARSDWEIIAAVSSALGYPMRYSNPGEVFAEMAALTPIYGGMNYERLENQGLQWPCPTPEHPGTRLLHEGTFTRGLGRFFPIAFRPPMETPDTEYPLILSTGRTLYNYNNGAMTRKSRVVRQKEKQSFVELHEETAAEHGIVDGALVQVETRRGKVVAPARIGDRVRPDMIWMPFHFVESMTNQLTNDVFDPDAGTAEYKCCAARIAPCPSSRQSA